MIRRLSPNVIKHEFGGICTTLEEEERSLVGVVAKCTILLLTVYWLSIAGGLDTDDWSTAMLSSSRRSASSRIAESKMSLSSRDVEKCGGGREGGALGGIE